MTKLSGVDIGTMNVVSAKQLDKDKVEFKSMRNMFLPISPEMLATHELANTQLDYAVQKDDNDEVENIFILGEDAFRFSQIFGQTVRRPMSKGVISTGEIDAIDVLTLMMEKLIGRSKGGTVVYSVPAQAVDIDTPPVLYHERVFNRVFGTLGYNSKPINEAMAIVYAECKNSDFSGITVSFGAGLTNICCSYKGQPTLMFAVSRGGDWIDKSAADSLGLVQTRITSVKERDLDLSNPLVGTKKERRVREALVFYYESLIQYVLKVFIAKFEEESEGLSIDAKIPIVVSGGTSLPIGFVDLFRDVFNKTKDFPYEISEIRAAKDPLTVVAKGALIYGAWEAKKDQKSKPAEVKETKELEENIDG